MTVPARPLAEVTQHAIRLLSRELGVADALRFLNQFAMGFGNYTADREDLFRNVSLDEILSSVRNSSSSTDPA
jgi:isopentenyldiphosphate isomerase